MLTHEGFVAADMSVPSPLQRSSWKADAIRRGDLKISGPIPITEDLPLNDDEEKEFAEKGGLEESLQLPEQTDKQSQRSETPPAPTQAPSSIPEKPSALNSNPVENHLAQGEDVPQRHSVRFTQGVRQVNEMPQENVAQSASYTTPNTPQAAQESANKAAQKKKRKSGLRSVFRKMFGRKSRDETELREEETVRKGHSYHHSVGYGEPLCASCH